MKAKLIKSTIVNFVNLVFSFILSFIMTPIILHRIGNDQYGIWVFLSIFSISGYFSLLDMGMQGTAIKYIAEYHAKRDARKLNEVISSVVLFFFAVGFVGGLLLLLLANTELYTFFNVPVQYQALVRILLNIIAVSFLFQFPAMGFSAVIEGLQRYDILRIPGITINVINSGFIIYYLSFINGIWFLTVMSIISSFMLALVYYMFSIRLLPEMRMSPFSFKIRTLLGLFNMSGQLFASRIVGLIFNNTDKIIIGIFLTMAAMTQYDIVNKVHGMMLMVMSIMNQAIVPFASRLDALHDEENLRKLFLKGTKYAVLFSMPALVFFMIMIKEFISVWVGREYAHLYLLAQFYMSHCFLTVLTGIASTMMVGMNRVKDVLKISVSMAMVNLIISLATVNVFGISGLIAGTVIAYIVGQIIYLRYFLKLFKIEVSVFVDNVIFKPFLLSSLIALVALFVKSHLVFSKIFHLFFMGVGIYFVFFLLYLIVDREERKLAFGLLKYMKAGCS